MNPLVKAILACEEFSLLYAHLPVPLHGPAPDRRSRQWTHAQTIEPARFQLRISPPTKAPAFDGTVAATCWEVKIYCSPSYESVTVFVDEHGVIQRTFPQGKGEDNFMAWRPLFEALVLDESNLAFVQSLDYSCSKLLAALLDRGLVTREDVRDVHVMLGADDEAEEEGGAS